MNFGLMIVVSVLRMVTAYDIGKAINPLALEGQIDGGTVQGLGYATMEELIHREGVVINPNLAGEIGHLVVRRSKQ
jgi:CO/xanthine dehydrogenase Mo-binding subunit